MTPEANRKASAAAQATAAMALLRWAARMLQPSVAAHEPELQAQYVESLQRGVSNLRKELSGMTFPDMDPVESDMWSQEAVEAFDDLASVFMEQLLKR